MRTLVKELIDLKKENMTIMKKSKNYSNSKCESINEIRSYILDYIVPMLKIDGLQHEHLNEIEDEI